MRQAGRSLPEYRAIRERHDFFEVANTPELCAEVTLQPVRRHAVDAAVMFADIMSPVFGMGVELELVEGVGPVVERPIEATRSVNPGWCGCFSGESEGSVNAFSSPISITSSPLAVPPSVPATLLTKCAIRCSVLASVVTESSLS